MFMKPPLVHTAPLWEFATNFDILAELLVVYSSAVLRLQQHLRRTPNPSLATLNYFLDEFKVHTPLRGQHRPTSVALQSSLTIESQ